MLQPKSDDEKQIKESSRIAFFDLDGTPDEKNLAIKILDNYLDPKPQDIDRSWSGEKKKT